MSRNVLARPDPADEVLAALDAFLVALKESIGRSESATRRAKTIRRLRSHGRSFHEILGRLKGALTQGVTREGLRNLVEAGERLERAEVRALHDEGIGLEEITALSRMTQAEVTRLLAPGE